MAFGKSLHTDTFKLGLDQFIEIYTLNHPYPTLVYELAKEAIMSGGPVPAGINADAGFMAYSSPTAKPRGDCHWMGFRPLDCFELLGTWLGRIWQFSCRLVCLDRLHYSKKKFGRQQRSLWLST